MRAVAGGQFIDLVDEPKPFDEAFGFFHHFFEGGIAALFGGVLDHFNLIELISAHHAAFFRAVGARLFAVAGRISEVFLWQFF